jgi:ABC-type oligopeptide transport system substrate-binding subunit
MNVRSRWFLLLTGVASATLVFAAACGGSDDNKDKTPAGGATTAATTSSGGSGDQAPADQQKITIAQPEPQFLDPHKSNFEQDIGVERMLFRGLYTLVDDGSGGVKVVPAMADGEPKMASASTGASGLASTQAAETVYTIKLKSGLKWSDGAPLTAKDFVFGLQRECDPAVASPYQYILGEGIGEVKGCDAFTKNTDPAQTEALKAAVGAKAVDDLTLQVTTNKPVATFTTIFSLWATFPAREDVITAKGDAWTDPANIVTNGPFTLKDLVAKDHLTLVPNPNFNGTKPALQEITVKFIDDLSASFKAFQTDELQMTQILATDVAVAKSSGLEKNVLVVPAARITTIETQLKDPVLAKDGVRLAISQAIDRQALVDNVYDGVYSAADYWLVKGLKGFQGNEKFQDKIGYNPTQAPKTLEAAGYPNGDGFPTLKWTTTDTEQRRNEFAFIQKALKDTLNINIESEFVDGKTRSARFNSEDFQLFPGGWQLDYPDVENPLAGLFNTDGGNNKYNCSNPDVDAAYQRAITATSEDARLKAYQDMETAVVDNLCGIIPLYQDARPYVVSEKIGGVVPNGTIDAGLPGNYAVENWFVKKG